MSERAAPQIDPGEVIRSRQYRSLLVISAVLGVIVSLASWCFLEIVHGLQEWVYSELPGELTRRPSTPSRYSRRSRATTCASW
jgi:hypothetical protein